MVVSTVRTSGIVNAVDGSFSIVAYPSCKFQTSFSNALNNVGRSTSLTSFDGNSAINIAANFLEGRAVCGGLRAFALFPDTSAPGVLFAGSTADLTYTDFGAVSTNTLSQYPGSRLGIGNRGALSTMRPYDNGSYEFFTWPIAGYSATGIPYMTSVYIAGLGFPIGTVIWYESILYIEALAKSVTGSAATPIDEPLPSNLAASNWFATPGQLLSAAQAYVTPSVIMDAVDATSSLARGDYRGAAMKAARSFGRHSMGSGKVWNKANVGQARQSSVVIEEMKDDGFHRI
jgi:hypothetical protein